MYVCCMCNSEVNPDHPTFGEHRGDYALRGMCPNCGKRTMLIVRPAVIGESDPDRASLQIEFHDDDGEID